MTTGFFNELLILLRFFFAQLKWSGPIYTDTAVSGLKQTGEMTKTVLLLSIPTRPHLCSCSSESGSTSFQHHHLTIQLSH